MVDRKPIVEELIKSAEKEARHLLKKYNLPDPEISRSLVVDLQRGDHKAYDTVYTKFFDSLKEYITSVIKNIEDAQELTQDVFFRLWEKHEEIDPDSNVKGFLFRTAKYFILDYFKRKRVHTKYENYVGNLFEFETAPDDLIVEKELQILAQITLEQMPPQRQRIFKMRFEQSKSIEEIAAELEVSLETVRWHLKFGKKDIQSILTVYFLLLFIAQQGISA